MRLRTLNKLALRRRRIPSRIVWNYVPTERQLEYHRKSESYKLYGGSMGGGKTVALCAEAIKLSLKYPGNRGYFSRNKLIDFKRSTLVTFMQVVPHELIKRQYQDERLIVLQNGSEIIYGGLGGEEDLERIKSTEFGWFAIDEATECNEEMFLLLCSRLRWQLRGGGLPSYHGLLASNPEPGWVKDRFVDNRFPDHIFVPALPRDNPHLPPDYDSNLRTLYPEEWVKRYLDGSWDVFTGQIYKEFDRDRHVYTQREIGKYWDKLRVIDHGYNNPTCCLWIAVDHDGGMWVYDEHYQSQLVIAEHAHIIKEKHPEFTGLTICDPSMFSRTMQHERKAWSPADEYRSHGVVCHKPYANDGWMSEGMGINLVKQRFKNNKLLIHATCTNTIRELLKYRWKDVRFKNANAPEIPTDLENHAVDCLRYATCYRPMSAEPPKAPVPKGTLHWEILKHKKMIGQQHFAGWR